MEMTIPAPALRLGGFVLGHALWNVSDMPDGECLVPLAISEHTGERELLRFEAETQELAIRMGKAEMVQLTGAVDAWAFARDGVFNEGTRSTDVITVDVWARGMKTPVSIVQRYEPFANRGRFKIIDAPLIIIQGEMVDPSEHEAALSELYHGLFQHAKAAELWEGWQ